MAAGSGPRRGRSEGSGPCATGGISLRAIPAGGPGSSRGQEPLPEWSLRGKLQMRGSPSRQTALQCLKAQMAAISQNPPPARPDRSLAAAQVADCVAGVLVILERRSSPAIATDIENVLRPLVAAHGDAVLYDLIEGIMQAMSRRSLSLAGRREMGSPSTVTDGRASRQSNQACGMRI